MDLDICIIYGHFNYYYDQKQHGKERKRERESHYSINARLRQTVVS